MMLFKNWMIMYGLVLGPIVYMIFGLTNTLPDAILTWIGAGIKPLGETQASAEMRSGMERQGASQRGLALGGGGARQLPPGTRSSPPGQQGLPGTTPNYAASAAAGAAGGYGFGYGSGYGGGAGTGYGSARGNKPISDTGQSGGQTTPDFVAPSAQPGRSGSGAEGRGALVTAGAAGAGGSSSDFKEDDKSSDRSSTTASRQTDQGGSDRPVNNDTSTARQGENDAEAQAKADTRTVDGDGQALSGAAASTAGAGAVLNADNAEGVQAANPRHTMADDRDDDRSVAA